MNDVDSPKSNVSLVGTNDETIAAWSGWIVIMVAATMMIVVVEKV